MTEQDRSFQAQRDHYRAETRGLADAIERCLSASGWDGDPGPLTDLNAAVEAFRTRERERHGLNA